jgi:tetratricopeptide (TPR) repeat protein
MLYGCSSQKDNATNRSLQNLSARYNLIYNSNVLLDAYQEDLATNNVDSYDHILSVYIAPPTIDYLSANSSVADSKTLDEIAQKAQTIVAEKGLSNYLDEAYTLLAKTNFYKGNYFTASAYFDYTAKAFGANHNIFVNAMTWKARSQMQLNEDENVIKVLDTVSLFLDSVKKHKAEPLATLAQMSIYQLDYKKAIDYLELAIKEGPKVQDKIRWCYILGQLYENEKQYESSLRYYTRVEKSNAPFEMYFNAKLSKIRISDIVSNRASNRKAQLLKLLKDDKNLDYTDQIYYEVAEDYFASQNYAKAEEYYKLAAQKSIRNPYQKGMAYLKLADLNFKTLGNYVDAKLYYDSAANTLPKTYSGYDAIVKKSENLEYLTNRYQVIATEDTLQTLARLPQQERASRMDKMFANAQQAANTPQRIEPQNTAVTNPNINATAQNATFYFSNLSAISTGFNDFKRRWGSRPLEDNWRQSVKSSAQVNQQNQANVISNGNSTANNGQKAADEDRAAQIAAYEARIPLTPTLLASSDQKIIDAYFEIAGFYQQVLNDQEEATKVYETLLNRYPKNNHLEAIYYSLYLGLASINQEKSIQYKNLVLNNYPNSVYAKTILDPNFSAKQNELDLLINKTYNSIFDLYEKKDFIHVIEQVNQINQRFPGNNLQPQYDYLKAISIGRTQPVDSLLIAFNTIVVQHPSDKLITPLVTDHLNYINNNLASFKSRKVALPDSDPNEPRFSIQQEPQVAKQPQSVVVLPKVDPKIVKPDSAITAQPVVNKPLIANPVAVAKTDSLTKPPVVDKLFSTTESSTYYYVVSVNDMSLSVSSSRFGIGQFNRGNYAGTGIKHQLLELNEDQLIFVGNFATLNDVKTYTQGINLQLNKIMKVPASTYKWFYISKENFDKIKDRATLTRYIEFFNNNYQ